MILSRKSKGFFVDLNDHTLTIARASGSDRSIVVEEIKSCTAKNSAAVENLLKEIQPKRSGNYVHATCGVYGASRLIRRAPVDQKRLKEPAYLNEIATNQCRIETDKYTLVALNPTDGLDFDPSNPAAKDVLFAGMAGEEINAIQKRLLETGIYPDKLELGTLAVLGALVDYLKFTETKSPTLVLEVDGESTQSYILSDSGVDAARVIPQGLDAMIPVVQKELGLKDEESARKLFYSNTFDFTGMAPALIKKLIKELQSSIGFYEVQTGQSIGNVFCTLVPSKMGWLQSAIGNQLGVGVLDVTCSAWLKARGITLATSLPAGEAESKYLGLFSLMLSHDHAVAS